ncbi:hypothetical protein EVJ58_g3709 [Rhodofomes roseus]|uniref:Uncharacterized protein n=1 Tax=Rhodofomes roseus TaxID=34475 RepID=A0A4Y9YJH7_9APHY|nr:hypothetical protein EVJ58_g3709 [Rhodofomes roseus]
MSVSSASSPIGGGDYAKRPKGFPSRIPGAAPQPIRAQGGSWSTMAAGMGIVAAGLLSFYYAQFSIQGKRTPMTVKNLTEIPTWQLRHAQQVEGAVAGLELPKHIDDNYTRFTPDFRPNAEASLPLPGRNLHGRRVVSDVLSALHVRDTSPSSKSVLIQDNEQGKGHADNDGNPRRIPQPAMTKRQEGHMYTKNSDYVDGYKPTHKVREMTSTTTVSSTSTKSTKLIRTPSILLTPSRETKRRKLDDNAEASSSARPAPQSPKRKDDAGGANVATPSPTEIWRWTLTKDAVASCFVKDVLDMRDSGHKAVSLPPPLPKPIADIGTPVRVIGRVVETSKGRQVLVDEIRSCPSPNDEPKHWLAVLELHRTRYFADHLGPFVVPPLKRREQSAWIPRSPEKDKGKARATDVPISPSKSNETGLGAIEPQTPSSSGMTSTDGSPALASSRLSNRQSPIRLRHPTRLHRRDLTANTFRIYLKHYMDNAPPPNAQDSDSAASSRSASPTPLARSQSSNTLALAMRGGPSGASLVTPRKTAITAGGGDDRTPRPSQLRARLSEVERELDRTARVGRAPTRTSVPEEPDNLSGDSLYGFTLSHLRRVPELMILARRVVDEEGRRRAKEERERQKAGPTNTTSKQRQVQPARPPEHKTKKTKRLFQFAIRQLYEEGSIVLWDGPTRPLPREDADSTQLPGPLWKANSSTASAMTASSIGDEDDPGQLSDPSPTEEAYISLTPEVLAGIVQRAIKECIEAAAARRSKHRHGGRPRADVDPTAPFAPPAPPAWPDTGGDHCVAASRCALGACGRVGGEGRAGVCEGGGKVLSSYCSV